MPETEDFIVVHLLDELPVGKTWLRSRNAWPLHITLVPWFSSTKDQLLNGLESVSREVLPFTITFDTVEQFNENTTVTLLADPTKMKMLHKYVLEAVTKLNNVQLTSMRWTGESYKAHVTHHEGMHVPETGQTHPVADFSLISLLPMNQCRLEAHFRLKGSL